MKPSQASSAPVARDAVGAATLDQMADVPAFNRWMFDRIAPWVGSRILEVGSGLGNMSRFFLDGDRVVLTDAEPAYLDVLSTRFGHRDKIDIVEMSLPGIPAELKGQQFDTIVCLNVLEHIQEDLESLRAMHSLLAPSGKLVLLVPALPALYGTLDQALGHFRRYTRRSLRSRYEAVGLRMRHLEYFNMAGIPGWWAVGRLLRRDMIPAGALKLFDLFVPLFRWERLLHFRIGQSLIGIGERVA